MDLYRMVEAAGLGNVRVSIRPRARYFNMEIYDREGNIRHYQIFGMDGDRVATERTIRELMDMARQLTT